MFRFSSVVALLLTACGPNGSALLDGRNAERAIEHIEPGMLIVTEVMINPDACSDGTGEWFEVKNLTDAWLQLEGITVTDADFYRSALTRFELAPHASAVVGRTSESGYCQSPPAAGFFEGEISLNNTGDAVHLYNHRTGILIDQTPRFPGSMVKPGESILLQPNAYDRFDNDSLDQWFVGSDCPYNPLPNSPAADNTACDFDAPAPGEGWFGLTCQGSLCTVPVDFDPAQNLGHAWNEAEDAFTWPDGVGDELFFESMGLRTNGVRAGDWFTTEHEPNVDYAFIIPGDEDEEIWDHWIFLDVNFSDIMIESDSSPGEQPLTRAESYAMLGGISLPGAIGQMAESNPDFKIHYARVAVFPGAVPTLELHDTDTDERVRWNATTGERLD